MYETKQSSITIIEFGRYLKRLILGDLETLKIGY